jgi:hypothetical protein
MADVLPAFEIGGSAEDGNPPGDVWEWTHHLTRLQPNFSVTHTALWTADIVLGLAAVAAVVYTVNVARQRRQYWPFFVLGASLMNTWYEPLNDIINHCAYPNRGELHTVYTWADRPIPLYILLVYVFYFTVPALFLMQKFEQGITKRQFWQYFFVIAGCAAVFEPLFVANNLWDYYGDNQPLNITGLPVWWWFANSMTVFITGAAFHLIRTRVFTMQWHCAAFLPLGPIVFMASHTTAGMPTWLAINSTAAMWVVLLGSFVTMGLTALYMKIFEKVLVGAGAPALAYAHRTTATQAAAQRSAPIAGN